MMLLPLIASVALAAGPVSLQYEGPLKDALKQIAQKGNLNIVASGDLDEPVQLNLSDITAEEALDTIAKVYGLELSKQGKMYVVRHGVASPVPALAPIAPLPPDDTAQSDSSEPAELAREAAEKAREAAEAVRERAFELSEQAQERAEALQEKAQDLAEARREQAEAARELAQAHAEFARNSMSAGGPVTVEKNTVVDTAVAYGGPVIVEENAVVEGNAVAFGGDVVLKENAVVNGDAVSFGGHVVRGENSAVHGETVSVGSAGLGSVLSQSVVKSHRIVTAENEEHHGNRVAIFLLQFALFFGLGFVLMMFAPQRMKALERTIRDEPGKNALAGLMTVPASLLVCFTLVGIPLVVLAWIFVAPVAIVIGLAAVANTIGAVVPTWRLRRTQAVALALGVLVMMIAFRIPVLGPIAALVATALSLGAIIRTRFGQPRGGTPILEPTPVGAGV